jgi:tartrate dehydrogenase/decarboxylase / D-malate dehydrogenase
MMLEHLGHAEAAGHIMRAVEASLADPATRTRDLGGTATTEQAGAAIVSLFEKV